MVVSVCDTVFNQSTILGEAEKPYIEWIGIKFGADIHGPQRINPTNFVIP